MVWRHLARIQLMGEREPEEFVKKVLAVATDLYPDGVLPDLPSWFPVDVLEEQPPATALLMWMVAVDHEASQLPIPLQQASWLLLGVWVGLETGDEEHFEFSLDALLDTSGRGWLANRMAALGLDLTDVRFEIQTLCVELIHELAERRAWVDDATKARGYFRNAFRNSLEDRMTALVAERDSAGVTGKRGGLRGGSLDAGCAPSTPGDFSPEERLSLETALKRAKLSDREAEVLALKYIEQRKGEDLAEALGTAPSTARVHILNAIKKVRKKT
jgi:DNA-directed RNA polymerase specialized sigma24 family protein